MSIPLTIIIVEKTGALKPLSIKDYKEEELFKKCGFKKAEDFVKQVNWSIKYDNKKYNISVFAKIEGRANSENKYDFPPPIDTKLFFGSCAIVASLKNDNGTSSPTDLSLLLWSKIYEKLFGGFEDLAATALEDENEEDELEKIPKEKKTKQGYLKDGFVVDSTDDENSASYVTEEESDMDNNNDETETETVEDEQDGDIVIDIIGSELSEDAYDYDTESESETE
jgi:hypothetical protein